MIICFRMTLCWELPRMASMPVLEGLANVTHSADFRALLRLAAGTQTTALLDPGWDNSTVLPVSSATSVTLAHGNRTGPAEVTATPDAPASITEILLVSVVVAVLALVTAGGNLMVILSFRMDKQLQTVSNYFLLSLAVADFAIGVFSMPLYTVYLLMRRWPLGAIVCDIWLSLDYTMSNASVANLLVISFDRYFSVTRPLTYRAKRTPRRAAIMIALAWVISAILWTPWIFAWPYIEGERTVPDDNCYIQFLQTNRYITVITAIAAYYLPVIIMCVIYYKIYMATERRRKDLKTLTAGNKDRSRSSCSKYGPCSSDEEVYITNLSQKRGDSSPELEDLVELNEALTRHCRKRTCLQRLRTCCGIDQETSDYNEDSSSSEPPGSPAYGQCTPSSSQHGASIRRDGSHVHQNGKQIKDSTSYALMIPLMAVDSSRSTPLMTPSTDVTNTTSHTSNLGGGEAAESARPDRKPRDEMYTILIKLPDSESGPDARPSIRMLSDSEDEVPAGETDALTSLAGTEEGAPSCDLQPVDSDAEDFHYRPDGSVPRDTSVSSLSRRLSQTTDSLRMAVQTKVAAKVANKIKNQRARNKRRQESKEENKAAKTLSAILLAFIVTWTPYNIFTVVQTFCSNECINDTLYAIGKSRFLLLVIFIFQWLITTVRDFHVTQTNEGAVNDTPGPDAI